MTLDSATSGDDNLPVTLGQLPKLLPWYDVIFPHILVNLTYSDLFKLRRVCKSFYQLVDAYFANCTTIDLTTTKTRAETTNAMTAKTTLSSASCDHKNCSSVSMNETGTNELLMATSESSDDQFNSCDHHNHPRPLELLRQGEYKVGQSSTGHSCCSSGEKLDDLPPKCTSSGHTIQFNSETFAIILRQKELYSAHRCLQSGSCFEGEGEDDEDEEEEKEEAFDSPDVNLYANTRSLQQSISSSKGKINEVEHTDEINMHPSVFYISKNFNSSEFKVNFAISNDEELVKLKYSQNYFSTHKSYGSTDQFDGCRCYNQVNCCQCKLCAKFHEYFTPTFEKIFLKPNVYSIELNIRKVNQAMKSKVKRKKCLSESSESKIEKEAKCNDFSVKNDHPVNRDEGSSLPSNHCHNQCKLATSSNGYCNNSVKQPVNLGKKFLTTCIDSSGEEIRVKNICHRDESKITRKISSIHHSNFQHVINSNLPSKNKVTGIKKLILSSCNWLTDGDLLRINNCCTLQPQLEVLDLSSCYQVSSELIHFLIYSQNNLSSNGKICSNCYSSSILLLFKFTLHV